jgi:hypothetical protein
MYRSSVPVRSASSQQVIESPSDIALYRPSLSPMRTVAACITAPRSPTNLPTNSLSLFSSIVGWMVIASLPPGPWLLSGPIVVLLQTS